MRAYFVTAIGTEIGKTHVASALLRAWARAGREVSALKPLMSGFSPDALEESDAGRLLQACGRPVTADTVAGICAFQFEAPLAPNVAARREGLALNYANVRAFAEARLAAMTVDRALVEGAGGVMSPVTDDRLHVHLMADLGRPAILVAAPYLGAISHTLTACAALDAAKIQISAIVVSQPDPASPPPEDLIHELRAWRAEPFVALPHGAADASQLAEILESSG